MDRRPQSARSAVPLALGGGRPADMGVFIIMRLCVGRPDPQNQWRASRFESVCGFAAVAVVISNDDDDGVAATTCQEGGAYHLKGEAVGGRTHDEMVCAAFAVHSGGDRA